MFYVITQPFFKMQTCNFVHIFISHCHLAYILFLTNLILGETLKIKNKNVENFGNFRNFLKFANPKARFCSPTNSTSGHIRQLIVALKLHPWR